MFNLVRVLKRLTELEEQMTKLARIVADRDLDWTEMRARCKRLLDRTEKAAKAVVESEQAELTPEAAGDGHLSHGELGTPASGFLTPKQRLIQEQILARRRANGLLPPSG